MKNSAASQLARQRWAKIPKKQRARFVPRTGGRPRLYPPCSRYRAHRFVHDRCRCGFVRTKS